MTQIAQLRSELERSFEGHPDAEIITSLPGLSSVLGARVLAEFGDDRTRYLDAGTPLISDTRPAAGGSPGLASDCAG